MASPSLLRSAAVRVLRRSTLQVPSAWSPRVFFSGVSGKIEPCKLPCRTEGGRICCVMETLLFQWEAHISQTRVLVDALLQEQRRIERNERIQKKIACVLLPATAALYMFGPEKKEKSPAEGQSTI